SGVADARGVPGVTVAALCRPNHIDGVFDGPGLDQCAPMIEFAVAGDPSGGHNQYLGARVDQRTCQFGKPQVITRHQPNRCPGDRYNRWLDTTFGPSPGPAITE